MTTDRDRFTLRMPMRMSELLDEQAKRWATTKTGAVVRILVEFFGEKYFDDGEAEAKQNTA